MITFKRDQMPLTLVHGKDELGSFTCMRGDGFISVAEYRYLIGNASPNYPVPTINRCLWCGEPYRNQMVCRFNGTGEWCPDFCFRLFS